MEMAFHDFLAAASAQGTIAAESALSNRALACTVPFVVSRL